MRIIDGSGDGARILQAWTPSGLEIDVSLDRGFDISNARLRGTPLAWLGPSGPQPRYMYEPHGYGWLRTFQGGLLTTCGLSHVGNPSSLSNEHNYPPANTLIHHGEHGRISHESAQLVERVITDGDDPTVVLTGLVREAALYSECLELKRTIELPLYRPEIIIRDTVTNLGALSARHEILYHVNLGYPLVSKGATISADSGGSVRRESIQSNTPTAAETVDSWAVVAGGDQLPTVHLENRSIGMGLEFSYSGTTLPTFLLWKLQRTKSNVLGFAPRSVRDGFLDPGQAVDYAVRFSFTTDEMVR